VPPGFDALQVWAAVAIGVFHAEVDKRVTTAACLDAMRKAGAIR